jgi:hypothetical protein
MKNEPNSMNESSFLSETFFLDFNHQNIQKFALTIDSNKCGKELAIQIYETVRDGFLYDPFHLDLRSDRLTASNICVRSRAWCVEKAILLCALFRYFGFPSKLGFGIVKNHIGVAKLHAYLKREEIVFHGFVEVKVDHIWSKCTPAFDKRVCKINGVPPLEWDCVNDSLLHPFSGKNKFMEYLHFYGSFQDVPIGLMHDEMKKFYPHLFEKVVNEKDFSFHFEPKWIGA